MQSEVPGKNKYILVELTDLGFSVAEHLKRANDLVLGVQPVDTAADFAGTGDIVVTNGDAEESAFGGGGAPSKLNHGLIRINDSDEYRILYDMISGRDGCICSEHRVQHDVL